MTSFAITLHGQCCLLHVVGQQVVSDISIIRSCSSICSMCSESNNANLLLLLLTDVLLGTSIVLQIQNIAQHTTLQRVAYL